MFNATCSADTPIFQCPHCGWPVEERAPEPVGGGLPVVIREKTVQRIAEEVAARLGNVTAHEILNIPRGGHRVERPRHEVMWRARQLRNPDGSRRMSLPQIGREFMKATGGMDHSSVINAVRNHDGVIRAEVIANVLSANAASALAHGGR